LALVVLIGIAILFASGALFIKYKLEGIRVVVQRTVEAKTGASVKVGDVLVNGLRGLRIDQAQVNFEMPGGVVLDIRVPIAYVNIDAADLFYGNVTIEQIEADDSVIFLRRPEKAKWFTSEGLSAKQFTNLLDAPAFRFTGNNATLQLKNVIGDSRLNIGNLDFDISRLTGSPDMAARLSGKLAQGSKPDFKVDVRFATLEDFDLRLQCGRISQDDVATVLPFTKDVARSGAVSPSIRVAGYPGNTMVVAFEAPFENVSVQNQPEFIYPAAGTLTGVATYDTSNQLLSLTTARVQTRQFDGALDGNVSFADEQPTLDLRCQVTRVPMRDVLEYTVADHPQEYASFEINLAEPYEMRMALQGMVEDPVVSVEGKAAGGEVSFEPHNKSYPKGNLHFGPMTLSWNSESDTASGSFSVIDGVLVHQATGIEAQEVAGTLSLDNKVITAKSVSAVVGGNAFAGSMQYDLANEKLEGSVSGILPDVEKLGLGTDEFSAKGPLTVRADVVRTENRYVVDGELDATQAEIEYQWWFRKPPGVGAAIQKMHAEIAPYKSIALKGNINLASSNLTAEARWACGKNKKWALSKAKTESNLIDISSIGGCLNIPYKLTGGKGTEGSLTWARSGKAWSLATSIRMDEAALLAEGAEKPMTFANVQIGVDLDTGDSRTGMLNLTAEKAQMPPIKCKWFATDEQYIERGRPESSEERLWTFHLNGNNVEVPPWKGSNFKGEAFNSSTQSGLNSFTAAIDGGGNIRGSYTSVRADSSYTLSLAWEDISSNYLIEQLEYPPMLEGTTTGQLAYSMDRDDPGTLNGTADFEVRDGHFSADYLISQLEGRLENRISSLPLSLTFDSLKADIDLNRDVVTTPQFHWHRQALTSRALGNL